MTWLKKVWEFVKRNWKWMLLILTAAGAGIAVARLASIRAERGKTSSRTPFVPDPRDETKIQVWTGKEFQPVQLPEGVVASEIKAVAVDESQKSAVVEVLHEAQNRRNREPIADSALSRLRRKDK